MDRRTALSVLTGVAAAVAGCQFVDPRPTDGQEATPPAPANDPEREVAETVPDDRVFSPTASAASGLTLAAVGWHAHDRVRYSPDDGDGFEYYEPDGRIVAYDFTLANRDAEPLEAVTDYEFVLRVDGDEYDHRHELGDDIDFAQVNQPADEPEIRRLTWHSDLEPGEREALQLLFEVDRHPEVPHYLVWYHDEPVEGSDAPAYVLPAE